MEKCKTFCLMAVLISIFMFVGNLIAGEQGTIIAFVLALFVNFFSYFFSDKLILRHYKAQEVNVVSSPVMFRVMKRLAMKADLPMPKIYVIEDNVPNAFATGRNPAHAAVAATSGLLDRLDENELEGVLAHEMSHIRHYDILISSIAAVFAGAIAMLSNSAGRNTYLTKKVRNNGNSLLLSLFLMPIAATLIRLSISRTREYAADEGSARLTKHPEWLMSALLKLEDFSKKFFLQNSTPQTAHMFIVNPLSNLNSKFSSLFSTHPSTSDRIKRLKNLQKEARL